MDKCSLNIFRICLKLAKYEFVMASGKFKKASPRIKKMVRDRYWQVRQDYWTAVTQGTVVS